MDASFWNLLGTVAAALTLAQVALTWRFWRVVSRDVSIENRAPNRAAAVLVPVKGIDPGLYDNLRSIVHQRYRPVHIIFITANRDDPAVSIIRDVTTEAGPQRASWVVAPSMPGTGEKVSNLLGGLATVPPDTEVLVFADSDIRPHEEWLASLVTPLDDPTVGVTTALPWYVPSPPGFWGVFRSLWNGGMACFFTIPRSAASGASMAVLRSTFEEAGVAQRWKGAVLDDLTLAEAVRRLGRSVRYVPHATAVTLEGCRAREFVRWALRRMVLLKIHEPLLWWVGGASYLLRQTLFVIGLGGLIAGAAGPEAVLGLAACVAVGPLTTLNGWLIARSAHRLLGRHGLAGTRWLAWYPFLAVPAELAAGLLWLLSLPRRTIRWRGITYTIRAPQVVEKHSHG